MNQVDKKDLYFVLQTLDCGGAETSILELCTSLANKGFNVNIIFFKKRNDLSYRIPKNVKSIYLYSSSWVSILITLYRLQKDQTRESIFISAMEIPNITLLLSKLFLSKNFKLIILIRCAFDDLVGSNIFRNNIIRLLTRILYPLSDLCITNSIYSSDKIIKLNIINRNKVKYIPNQVDICKYKELSKEINIDSINESPYILCLGNVNKVKNYQLALKAFYYIQKQNKNLNLVVLGAIQSKQTYLHLQKLANNLNISKSIKFKGYVKNPFPWIRNSEMLLHTSLSEGFPNAVIQSISLKKPVLITTMRGDGKYLCDQFKWCKHINSSSPLEIANAVFKLLENSKILEKDISFLNNFSIENVSTKYEEEISKK